jgi:translocation and assembly module TamB
MARVDLDANEAGDLRIARAFAPRTVSSGPPARPVRVTLDDMRLEHAHVQGKPNGVPPIEGDVAAAQGWLHFRTGSLEIDVSRSTVSDAAVPGLGAKAAGNVTTHLALPSARGREIGLATTFDGHVGELPTTVAVTLDGADLDIKVDGEHATPQWVRSVWAACPFTEEASLHAHAHGTLPKLDFDAKATLGNGRLEIDKGTATLGPGTSASAHTVFTSLDAHAFHASAPVSEMSGSADLSITVPVQGTAGGRVEADLAAGRFAGQPTPAAGVRGKVTFDPRDPQTLRATAKVDLREAGAPTSVTLLLTPKNASFALAFEGRATAPNLDAVSHLGGVAHGQGAAAVEGMLDFGTNRVDAEAQVTASHLGAGGASVHGVSVVAHVSGPLRSPEFDAVLLGGGAQIGPLHFTSVRAASKGTLAGAPIDVTLSGSAANVHASAIASFAPAPGLRDVVVILEKGEHHVEARAAVASVAGGETRLDDVEVVGLGAPLHAALRQSPGALYLRAHSRRVDLAPIGDLLGLENARGRMRVDIDALLRANGAQGRVQIDLHDAALEALSGVEAHLATTLDGRHISGTLSVDVADIGKLDMHTTSLEIGGSDAPSWSYWKRAFGTADAEAHVDLAKLAAHLPQGSSIPFEANRGVVDVAAHFDRDSMADATPGVDLSVRTRGLVIGDGSAATPWRIEGIDGAGRVKVDGGTGRTALELQLADPGGPLLALSAMSDGVPYGAFFGGANVFDAVMNMPFSAQLTIPARELDTLPAFLGTKGARGQVVADLRWVGTPLHPTIDVTGALREGRADVRLFALPVDVAGSGHYDGALFAMAVAASSRGRLALQSSAEVDARAEDMIRWARGGPAVWRATVRAKLASFPLQSVGAFDDRGVRGRVTGELALDGWHDDAKATASLAFDGLKVGDLAYKGAKLTATIDGNEAKADARVDQADGFAEAHATLGTHWGSALAPTLDASRPIDLSLLAKEFRLGLLAPFVATFMSELDGRLAADVHVRVDPATHTVVPQGALAVQDGAFELVSLGGPFHDVSGQAVFSPDGVVRIGNVSAHGMTGRLAAAATARMDGHGLSALRGELVVGQKEQLPVVFDDVQVGTFFGSLSVDANRRPDGSAMDIGVGVQSMHMALPLAANRDVQALGNIQGLKVVRRATARHEIDASADAPVRTAQVRGMPLNVTIDLGRDTEVKQGTTLDVVLQGKPMIALDGDVRAGGEIRLARGTISIQGKDFTIENGTVTFMGDPTNPQVALTAKWAAPDQTIVYADFIGPLKTGKVTLHSDPSHSQQEILAYILFGTADDPNATASTQGAGGTQGLNVVGGAAGAAATQPINRMLDGFGLAGGVSTKIDTSGTSPRPEVEVRIARDITLQVAWVLGVPPPGTNPDSTLVSLNWHFLRKWSLETTVGDAGTSIVDLIWQQRY